MLVVQLDFDVDRFRTDGVVAVRQAFSREAAIAMQGTIWRRVEGQTAARRDDPSSWQAVALPSFKPIKQRSVFHPIAESSAVRTALDEIFGPSEWEPSGSGVQVLMTLPNATRWTLPHHLWHMDGDFEPIAPTTMVKLFCCVDTVDPGGGGTLALTGSHRLVDGYCADLRGDTRVGNSVSWRRLLTRSSWTRDLVRPGEEPARTNRLMVSPGEADGVELRIVEMTGAPGDVYITDIHTFHCVAPNASRRPRIMIGRLFRRRSRT
jgi:hypothetical protein